MTLAVWDFEVPLLPKLFKFDSSRFPEVAIQCEPVSWRTEKAGVTKTIVAYGGVGGEVWTKPAGAKIAKSFGI